MQYAYCSEIMFQGFVRCSLKVVLRQIVKYLVSYALALPASRELPGLLLAIHKKKPVRKVRQRLNQQPHEELPNSV